MSPSTSTRSVSCNAGAFRIVSDEMHPISGGSLRIVSDVSSGHGCRRLGGEIGTRSARSDPIEAQRARFRSGGTQIAPDRYVRQ